MRKLTVVGLALAFSATTLIQAQEFGRNYRRARASKNGSAAIHFELDPDATPAEQPELLLRLPDRFAPMRAVGRMAKLGDGQNGLWRGKSSEVEDSDVSLTFHDGFVAGTIRVGNEVYEVRPDADGQVVEKVDFSAFDRCAGTVPAPSAEAAADEVAAASGDEQADAILAKPGAARYAAEAAPVANEAAATYTVDLLSLYTPQARAAAGGVAQITATIQAAVDQANQAFVNSGVGIVYRLVSTAEAAHSDAGSITSDLSWLSGDAGVAALRNQVGADMVSLIVESGGGYCGVGYVMSSPGASFSSAAMQVTARGCAVGNMTFAHEHGHNLGLEHDLANGSAPNEASYPWSFGHYVNGVFRTVMSYSSGCPNGCARVPYYSNPNVTYLGYPTGLANAADNARTANLTAPIVAAFRGSSSNPAPTAPTAPSGLTASAVGSSQINLTWTDQSSNETGFRIERAVSSQGSWSPIATLTAGSTSYASTGLTGGTGYSFRVRAYNSAGDSAYSNVAAATTSSAGSSPAAPSGLTVTAVSASQINLTWGDQSSNETGFRVERCLSAEGAWTQVADLPAGTTSYASMGLLAGTSYSYRVKAYNASGESAYTNIGAATTTASSSTGTAPAAPAALSAVAASSSQINIAWSDQSANETGFRVERCLSAQGAWSLVATLPAGTTSYASTTGLEAGISYSFRVKAYNAAGESAYSNIGAATTSSSSSSGTAPAAPAALVASAVSSSQINIAWSDQSANETGFRVERCLSAQGAWSLVATLPAGSTSYASTGLTAGTGYSFRVKAYNAAGESAYSNIGAATTSSSSSSGAAPASPVALSAVAVSSSQINIAWSDQSANESGFRVERCLSAQGAWSLVATLPAGATSYASTGLVAGASYSFRVKAYNAAGESAYTNIAAATTSGGSTAVTAPAAPTGLSAVAVNSGQINIAWTGQSTNESGFRVERCLSAQGAWSVVAVLPAGSTSYASTGLVASTSYSYRVKAYNATGESGYTNIAAATTSTSAAAASTPGSPSGLIASAVGSGQINLSWSDGSSNEEGFRIERAATVGSGGYAVIATVGPNATFFANAGLAASTQYAYRVRAYNSAGTSRYTNTAVTTTGR